MNHAELIALARQTAAKYGLDAALACAVVEQESAWNTFAIRYEPGFFDRYIVPLHIANATEERARSFSWGLMQVMGQVAREHGFEGSLAVLCDPATGLDVGCKVLAHKLAAANGDLEAGLLRWNGGANPGYPAQVLARAQRYQTAGNDEAVEDATVGEK